MQACMHQSELAILLAECLRFIFLFVASHHSYFNVLSLLLSAITFYILQDFFLFRHSKVYGANIAIIANYNLFNYITHL